MTNRLLQLLQHEPHLCPWWLAYSFDNRLRQWVHRPERLLAGFVRPGRTVMDIGCGMGCFSVAMAELVGETGRVIAVDIQKKLLDITRRRAIRKGVASRICFHRCTPDHIGITEPLDFILAFWMVHEVRNQEHFLHEAAGLLKPGGHFLIAEPKLHTTIPGFQKTVDLACAAGLNVHSNPPIRFSRAVVLERP